MSTIKRITVFIFAALILVANLPLCASAVDPVSAATMANALAQAITAYGASQGVSMTFDVVDTDGIGEGVHDLWDQFVADVNNPDTPTYDSLAVTMWSNLYSKIGNNLGINISVSEMPYIDSFWNWLLSGPAEMSKVDNQYFEWSYNQNNTVDPIMVYNNIQTIVNGYTGYSLPVTGYYDWVDGSGYNRKGGVKYTQNSGADSIYVVYTQYSNMLYIFFLSDSTGSVTRTTYIDSNNSWSGNTNYNLSFSSSKQCYSYLLPDTEMQNCIDDFASLPTLSDFEASFSNGLEASETNNPISVRPYIGDAVPQNVYIPDNTDVNYNPTDVAIPLDIPWDNTLFGDGDGVLTDAQSEAAASAADDAITNSVEKTLTIADTENPDIPAPGEVYIPFLPVELPSFNFNLSGIWHYVREWISSLGTWFTTVLTVWASLPYAMVIPVYATLVIVIVLGVYKRFFM